MDVTEAGQVVVIMLSPTLLLGAGLLAPKVIRAVRRRVRRRRANDVLRPIHPPIEQLAADLRRLLQRHDAVKQSTDVAVRARHLRAIEAAIADCAGEAAHALGLPCPDRPKHGALTTPALCVLLRALADAGLVLVPGAGLLTADGLS
ncbi:MAG: hypothetical protein M3083_22860 [Actinomycetota bacterium]|nr:hypothetical protein [Actinomycetota bacterium]MDQ6945191.1 hypothetical protein [Actinomycetota bacterium]